MFTTADLKRTILLILPLILLAVFIFFKFRNEDLKAIFADDFNEAAAEPVLGLFVSDPAQPQLVPALKHFTITWKNTAIRFDDADLRQQVARANVLLTVQTWSKDSFFSSSTDNVLQETLNGEFDDRIGALGEILNKTNMLIYVRWNPDMELSSNKFPWQQQSPLLYIQAFHYFSQKLKKAAPQVKVVWGPKGYPGDTEYYPGDEDVDVVSVSLGNVTEEESAVYTFSSIPTEDLLRQKLHRMRLIDKPVLIIGSEAIQNRNFSPEWLQKARQYLREDQSTVYTKNNLNARAQRPLRKNLKIGLYDPNKNLVGDPQISVEHIFINWGEIEDGNFQKKMDEINDRGHSPIVTLEPWRDQSGIPDSNVLKSMLNGRYDLQIKKFYKVLSNVNQTVYLRFAHEMEIPIHRYAWQSQDPVTYINAYRYFMKFADHNGGNIRKVWGPAGDRGSIDFWPGDDVVDYISIAIYGLPDKNITDHTKQEAFSQIFSRKMYRMRFVAKPIFITEFGVKGPESFQSAWLQAAAEVLKENQFVFGVCYFNLHDNPKVWGKAMDAPDWSISKSTLKAFLTTLGEGRP
jgi:beta-mannanase